MEASTPRNGASSCPTSSSSIRRSWPRPRARARSPSSTATTASSVTGAIRSSSSPSNRPTSRSPTWCATASCPTKDAARAVGARDHLPHVHPREHAQALHRGLPLRRPPHGHLHLRRRRPVDLLPRGQGHPRPRGPAKQVVRLVAKMPTLAACAYRFFVGMPFVYPDNGLDFTGNFLNMMFAPLEHIPYERPGDGPGARRAVHPPCRPRAELLDHRDARGRQLRRRPLHLRRRRRWPRSTARATAAPTRPWSACSPRSARSTTSPTSSSR